MNRLPFALVTVIMVLLLPATAWSKGATVKIEIRGDCLASPVEIIDPEVVKSFTIWNGPGVGHDGEPLHLDPDNQVGAFIDWPGGVVLEPSRGLQRYVVTLYIEGRRPPHHQYLVIYEFDPSAQGGYMYLPGEGDQSVRANTHLIYHGVEGNWFYSSNAWEKLVRPFVEKSTAEQLRRWDK